MVKNNINYESERKIQNEWAKRDFEIEKALEEVHKQTISDIQSKIDDYYLKYAKDTGLTLADARKKIKGFDVTEWQEKARNEVHKAIRDMKTNPMAYKANKQLKMDYFAPKTNEWLKTYNRKMYISRLEYMKAEIIIDLQKMYAQDHVLIDGYLERKYLDEIERQAGILGQSAKGSPKRARAILNADFYGNSFSEKVWGRNGLYESTSNNVFQSFMRMHSDISNFKKERKHLSVKFGVSLSEANRLLRTESTRMSVSAQKDVYDQIGMDYFIWIIESDACKHCKAFDRKLIPMSDFEIGVTAPPIHPNDRCSTMGIHKLERKDGTTNVDEYEPY